MAEATYYAGVKASAAAANRHHLTIYNPSGSGKTLKVLTVRASGAPAAAGTGLVIPLSVHRFVTATVPNGTPVAFNKMVATDGDLPAGVIARTLPTNIAGLIAEPFGVGIVSGEETAAPGVCELYGFQFVGGKRPNLEPGSGMTVQQGALASAVGNAGIVVIFTAV